MAVKLSRAQTVALARSFKGISENPPYSNRVIFSAWYGFAAAWCAMFVSYVLTHAGYPFKNASVLSITNWAKDNGRFFTNKHDAKPGDLTIFWFSGGPNRPNHIGMFTGLTSDGRVTNVEGNTGSNNRDGGSVQERSRSTGVYGFVRMDYAQEALSQWPKLTRVLRYGVAPGNDIVTWKLYMNLIGVAPEFSGMTLEQLRTFGKTTSPNAAYRFSVLWNGIYDLKPGDRGHLVENHEVDADDWAALIWSVATRK